MVAPSLITTPLVLLLVAKTAFLKVHQNRDSCIITSYSQLDDAVSKCVDIVIRNITVPGGQTLDMKLQNGTSVIFEGKTIFDYEEWNGPLVHIRGHGITVQGAAGHSLDGQGSKYWDGLGGNGGKTKPIFFRIQATRESVFKSMNVLNCPRHCVSISGSEDVSFSKWNIDCSDGDVALKGHNTDGFGISSSSNITIEDSVVKNQDDCVVIHDGSDMKFYRLSCSGGHGLSLSVGMSKTSVTSNTVKNVYFSNCTVENSRNGIHIKTHIDGGVGLITNITYSNIKLPNITVYGINIQQDYEDGSSTGTPKDNVPITEFTLKDISVSLAGSDAQPVYVLCAPGGCSNWSWSEISLKETDNFRTAVIFEE